MIGLGSDKNNSEKPVDVLAVKKGESLTDNLKSRDARASKKLEISAPKNITCMSL